MPTPRRSSQRPRRNSWRKDTAHVDEPLDSSPSRPVKRRKQAEESPRDIPEEEPSSLLADSSAINPNDETQMVTRVTQHLLAPHDEIVRASKDHANSIHEANKEGVQAYAKIAAQDWTFYVTKLNINIGRTSEPPPEYPELYDPETDPDFVHIDLGPSKMVSRQHAQIVFNSKNEQWYLQVKGRNGVKVNNMPWRLGQSKPLDSGDVIEIGGVEMMFVLPLETSPLNIHDVYLQRAGIKTENGQPSAEETPLRHRLRATTPIASESSPRGSTTRNALPRGQPTPQAIAPAPPDYKRPGTPPSARSRVSVPGSHFKSPHFRDIPTMVVHPNDVDLSLDENKNLKPQYSYAQMITQAIMNTADGKLNLNGIYNFIMDNYSYYKHQQAAGWQNSIRHNLSLNKAFEKVARSTEEPGKGMKWYILPEYKDEMIRTAYRGGRGGHRGSSNPSSPSQLNYVNQGPRDMAARDLGSARKRRVSPSGSPQPRSTLRDMQTPDRSSRRLLPDEAPASSDGSPLPRYRRGAAARAAANNSTAGEGSALATVPESTPRSPILTSTFLQDETVSSFVTPAPHRVELKLNPPSTLQRPSQHMPTSSPAPFWKYADIGSTPLKSGGGGGFDFSPSKTLGLGSGGGGGALPPSSSPPPAATRSKSPPESPVRRGRSAQPEPAAETKEEEASPEKEKVEADAEADDKASASVSAPPVDEEEDGGFDLTKGFQSIGSYHAPVRHGLPVATAMNGNQ